MYYIENGEQTIAGTASSAYWEGGGRTCGEVGFTIWAEIFPHLEWIKETIKTAELPDLTKP